MSQCYAVIDPASPRYASLLRYFGTDALPIVAGEPELVRIGECEPEPFFLLDPARLGSEHFERIVTTTARDLGVDPEEVRQDFADGVTLRPGADLVVCFDPVEGRTRLPSWPKIRIDSPVAEGGL